MGSALVAWQEQTARARTLRHYAGVAVAKHSSVTRRNVLAAWRDVLESRRFVTCSVVCGVYAQKQRRHFDVENWLDLLSSQAELCL